MNKKEAVNILFDNSTMSIDETVDALGITRATFAFWRSGKSNPKKQYLNKLALLIGYRVKWLDNDELELVKAEPSNTSEPFHVPMDTRKAPVITMASAGLETYPEILNMTDSYVSIPKGLPDDVFGVKVVGDSAAPRYDDGDICIVSPKKPFINNKACFIALKNGEFYIKKVEKRYGSYTLIPYNENYETLEIPESDITAVFNILHTRHNV